MTELTKPNRRDFFKTIGLMGFYNFQFVELIPLSDCVILEELFSLPKGVILWQLYSNVINLYFV